MTVDMLDTGTILVTLGESDMRAYTLDFSETSDSSRLREGLTALLYRVGDMCGLESGGKSFLIEALPSHGACLLIISVREVRRRRVFRIKREKTQAVCIFDGCDPLLDYLSRGADRLSGYSVYEYNGSYALIPEPLASSQALSELSEYGRLLSVSPVAAARIREHGKQLTQRRAQRRYPSIAAK